MNERIRKLADEAARYSATLCLPTGKNGDELFVEKFAELIMTQCIFEMVHESTKIGNTDIQDFTVAVSERIKKHFGVE